LQIKTSLPWVIENTLNFIILLEFMVRLADLFNYLFVDRQFQQYYSSLAF
jgi:ABC-type multidrug transport system permease subunit